LLKHFSYYIQPGAKKLKTDGNNSELLAFINPDKSLVIIVGNKAETASAINIKTGRKNLVAQVEPHSFNTFIIK